MMTRVVKSPGFWIPLLLVVANGLAWVYALAPAGAAVRVEPRLAPHVADLRQQLAEGGHSGEPFSVEVTDQEAAETVAWYLSRNPHIPFGEPQVFITPRGITAQGVAEIAGLRVGLAGEAHIELRDGVLYVTLRHLDVAGVAVPGLVRDRIQSEIDDQFSLAQNLPVVVHELVLEEGKATVRGMIR